MWWYRLSVDAELVPPSGGQDVSRPRDSGHPSPGPRTHGKRQRPHRIYHRRWCPEHAQDEVCLCTKGSDHHARLTTVSKSQQALARWCERVNRAHRGAWAHERNVRAWLHVYGRYALGARTFVGTYAREGELTSGVLEMSPAALTRQSMDALSLFGGSAEQDGSDAF